MSWARAAAVIAAVFAAVGVARSARAEVRVTAPNGCPSGEDISKRVGELTGGKEVDADVTLVHRAHVYSATIAMHRPTAGERTLEGPDCASVGKSAALVIAMSAGIASSSGAEAAGIAAPEPAPTGEPNPPENRRVQPRASDSEGGRSLFRAAVLGGVDVGTLPDANAMVAVAAGISGSHMRGEIEGALTGTRRTEVAAAVGGEFSLLRAAARGCLVSGASTLEVAPCLGVAVARIGAQGFGGTVNGKDASVFVAPELGAHAYVPLGRVVAIRLSLDAALPITRQTFVIAGAGAVHRPAALTLRGLVGPEFRF